MDDGHGSKTVILSGATAVLGCKTSTFTGGAKTHDLTTYGKTHDVHKGGLKTGGFTMGGVYETGGAAGTPSVLFQGNEGNTFALTRRPEGTGSSKPQQVFDAVLSSYVETDPVDDYISWSSEFVISDDVNYADQGA